MKPATHASTVPRPGDAARSYLDGTQAAGIALLLALIPATLRNLDRLNTDAIAYLRLAEYYARGQTDLMISGYWGPLLSWLIAPLIALGLPALTAGHLVVAATALAFWRGCLALLKAAALSPEAKVAGAWLAAGAAVVWSIDNLTPDLLVAGLILGGVSESFHPDWCHDSKRQVRAGVLWGLAYLAKAIAFPMAWLCLGALVVLRLLPSPRLPKSLVLKAAGRTVAVTLLLALPWITALSFKYGTLTFSTTAKIAHAVAGPKDIDRYHPFARAFHQPAAGRTTSWEDPPPAIYAYWTPWESPEYARHQWQVARENLGIIRSLYQGFDALGMGLAAVAIGAIMLATGFARNDTQAWPLMLIPTASITLLYLPFPLSLAETRYFYLAYPLLLTSALLLASILTRRPQPQARFLGRACAVATIGSFALPVAVGLVMVLKGIPDPASLTAQDMARRMRAAQLHGPIAGSALLGNGRPGLYIAYFLGAPWFGDRKDPVAAEYANSGARFIVVRRNSILADALAAHPSFRNLDDRLFAPHEDPRQSPLRMFEVRAPAQPRQLGPRADELSQ